MLIIIFKYIFYFILRSTFLHILCREIFQKSKITIVAYHNITVKTANRAFKYYLKRYNLISLNSFITEIYNKRSGRIPKKALIITLDDGYKENYLLYNLIKKDNIPVTIFLCSDIINTKKKIWTYKSLSKKMKNKLKKVNDSTRISILNSMELDENREYDKRTFLSKDEINKMKSVIDFQSHTKTHPMLPHCSDDKSNYEISNSKYLLEKEYGLRINSLAYPDGIYSSREIAYLKKSGYKSGLTLDYGYNTIYTDPFRLKRIPIDDRASIHEIIVKTSGLYDFLKKYILRIKKTGLKKYYS